MNAIKRIEKAELRRPRWHGALDGNLVNANIL
jgi:hypothetical protein